MRAEAAAGRKAGVAAVAVAVVGFAVFLGVLPQIQGDDATVVRSDSATVDAIPVVETGSDPAPTSTPDPPTSVPAPATSTTIGSGVPPPSESPFRIDAPPGEDARLDFSAEVGIGGEGAAVLHDGDDVLWSFRVANAGTEFLWGVYVYLELHGPVRCGTTRLAPGESTTCEARATVYQGEHTAWAWVTAWTETSMIATDLRHAYVVAP